MRGAARMNIFRSIARALKDNRTHDVATRVHDDVRVDSSGDWRKKKLAQAAQKYGRLFRCAGEDMRRQVMLRGKIATLEGTDPTVGA